MVPWSRMSDLEPIGAGLDDLLARLGMPPPSDVAALVDEWVELAGEPFGARSTPAGLRDGVLTVVVDDGSVASLLRYREGELIDRLATRLGAGVVTAITIRVGQPKKAT